VPRVLGDDPHRQPVLRIGAAEHVLDVDIGPLQRREDVAAQLLEMLRRHRPVDRAPRDVLIAHFLDQKFVFG
jgi:hypothetical protein